MSDRIIQLNHGQEAIVDEADHDWLMQWKWRTHESSDGHKFYAIRTVRSAGKKGMLLMHRAILGLSPQDGNFVDHISGDTLDNRRSNLRLATPAQNSRNYPKPRNNTSGFKGVFRHGKHWETHIRVDGKQIYLGIFATPQEAHLAYCYAAKHYHGEFARFE